MRIMNSRRARQAAAGAALACTAVLVTACSPTAGASAAGGGSVAVSSQTVTTARTAPKVYLAEGQDIRGTAVFRPACRSGCALSGDSTAFLRKMTWKTWSATKAVGTGIYELDGCNPNCAAGPIYHVPAVVTFSHPVKACVSGKTRWFWSKASFRFPKGLPKALRGDNAPENPWTFSSLIDAARQSCRG
jgi:hypothetical protein